MSLFGKATCTFCSDEVGALNRTRLRDKESKKYICKSCVKTKLSPYVEAGHMSEEEINNHLMQREKDKEIYEKYFGDYKANTIFGESGQGQWSSWQLGKYELRRHNESGYYIIWERYPEEEQTYDVFNESEVEAASIWGQYRGKSADKPNKLEDITKMYPEDLKNYPDRNIEKLYATIFTRHPFLAEIDVPLIEKAGREKEMTTIRERALLTVEFLNKPYEQEHAASYVSKKSMRKSGKEARKSLFGAIKKGDFGEGDLENISNFLGKASARNNRTSLDERVAELRERNRSNKPF